MNKPEIEAVVVDVDANTLIRLLAPNNKSGILFYTKSGKGEKVFVESSKSRPKIVK